MLWVLGCVLDYCIGFGRLLCFGIDCWEVLCVLRDLLVEMLGGLRNGLKV